MMSVGSRKDLRAAVPSPGRRSPDAPGAPIRMMDLELSLPLPAMGRLDGYAAVLGIVRLRGVPIGTTELPVSDGRAPDGRAIARKVTDHLAEALSVELLRSALGRALPERRPPLLTLLQAPSEAAPAPLPSTLTVAVCTRERPELLADCLEALVGAARRGTEVLVVDNAPTTGAVERVVRERFPTVRYVREPLPGLNRARNRAIREARGDLLAFTDDDVIVDPGWVGAISDVFAADPTLQAMTGLVVPFELETTAQLLFEAYGGFGRGFSRSWHRVDVAGGARMSPDQRSPGSLGTGANMAFRRGVFERIGPFDPALDTGTRTEGGGDLEIFFRVLKEGHALVYEPRALVRHRHRREYGELRRQLRGWGTGHSAYMARSWLAYPDERRGFERLAFRLLVLRTARRLIHASPPVPRGLIGTEFVGALRGPFRYLSERRRTTAAERGGGPVPPRDPVEARVGGVHLDRPTVRARVEVGRPLQALEGFGEAGAVLIEVEWGGRSLGRVLLPCWEGMISSERLKDAIASQLVNELLPLFAGSHGGGWKAALQEELTRRWNRGGGV